MQTRVSLLEGAVHSLPRASSSCIALCYPLIVCRSPLQQQSLLIFDLTRQNQQPLLISTVHQRPIDSICFNLAPHMPGLEIDSPSYQLCSVSKDIMLLWDIMRTADMYDAQHHPLLKDCGQVSFSTFDPTGKFIGLAADSTFDIFEVETSRHLIRLEGHEQPITCAVFGGKRHQFLVTCSEDRSFKIWNLETKQLAYQSGILSASPLLSLAIDPDHERFVVGSADGKLRFYRLDPSNGHGGRCLRELNLHSWFSSKLVAEQEQKVDTGPVVISSVPPWKLMTEQMPTDEATLPMKPEVDCPIIYLSFVGAPIQSSGQKDAPASPFLSDVSRQKELTRHGSQLLVGTTVGLVQVDSQTQEAVSILDFSRVCEASEPESPSSGITFSATTYAMAAFTETSCFCCAANPFLPKIYSFVATTAPVTELMDATVSVFPTKPAAASSYLNTEFIQKIETKPDPKGQKKLGRSISSSALKDKSGKVVDKPVTFHNRIKSSGYGSTPPVILKGKQVLKRSGSSSSLLERKYPVNCNPPHIPQPRAASIPPHTGAILRVVYSNSGERIASCSSDKVVREVKLPLAKFKGDGTDYRGHNGPVLSLSYNLKNDHLLTSSSDRTVRLWESSSPDPLLVLKTSANNYKDDPKENPEFSAPIRQARFFYMDKFIFLCCGNRLLGYKYLIEETKKDELLRFQNNNKYKLAVRLSSDAQSITDFACVNSFLSHIAICASTDRSLTVFDLAAKSVVRRISDAHSRPVHSVRMCENSPFVSHPAESYELFLTSATDNCIKLWDLRANRFVRRFEGHANRIHDVGMAFSPCLRFMASGSEDKAAYLYDLRMGTVLHKLMGHTDAVTDVAFHPLHPQLATGCLDGRVRMFNEKETPAAPRS
eukprot:TRINITY_DN7750_c0_g1_i1.p1 TRINITY_DN7750_c0_g1~~TRINITY_DN7750_c0_g1_i1.p1  ORF type:complete len:881 (+),score=138.30 TRINITY_DN7750_c0_g1_i1:71-2713(+)